MGDTERQGDDRRDEESLRCVYISNKKNVYI